MTNSVITTSTAVISTLRLFVSSVAGIIGASVYLATASVGSLKTAFCGFAVILLTSGFGFVVNDCVDTEKDRINHPDRALVSGRLSKKQALFIAFLFAAASIFLSFNLNTTALLVDVGTVLLLSIYSFVNNRYGIWANGITAVSSSLTIVFGMSIGTFSLPLMIAAGGTFFMIFGREIVLDIRDLLADKSIGKTSVPIRLGIERALDICIYLFGVSSLLFIVSSIMWSTVWFTLFVGVLLNLLLWIGIVLCRSQPSALGIERFLLLTRFAFLCLVPAILL
ncbi:MAG: UbiA family prenyltransferase [Ignavibacteria bacterium]|nr:UbiA family prenyltransferase [Ignavibacteria bacterium]